MNYKTVYNTMFKRAAEAKGKAKATKKPATKTVTRSIADFGVNIDHKNNTLGYAFIDNGPMRAEYDEPRPIPPVVSPVLGGPTPLAALNNTGRWNDYRPGEPDWRTVLLNSMRKGFKTKEHGEQFATDASEAEKAYLGSQWANWPISKPNTQKPVKTTKAKQKSAAKTKDTKKK